MFRAFCRKFLLPVISRGWRYWNKVETKFTRYIHLNSSTKIANKQKGNKKKLQKMEGKKTGAKIYKLKMLCPLLLKSKTTYENRWLNRMFGMNAALNIRFHLSWTNKNKNRAKKWIEKFNNALFTKNYWKNRNQIEEVHRNQQKENKFESKTLTLVHSVFGPKQPKNWWPNIVEKNFCFFHSDNSMGFLSVYYNRPYGIHTINTTTRKIPLTGSEKYCYMWLFPAIRNSKNPTRPTWLWIVDCRLYNRNNNCTWPNVRVHNMNEKTKWLLRLDAQHEPTQPIISHVMWEKWWYNFRK